jgi:hypothetical protein
MEINTFWGVKPCNPVVKHQPAVSETSVNIYLADEMKSHARRQLFSHTSMFVYLKKNSVALVRKQTMPTERPPLLGEVVPTFCG